MADSMSNWYSRSDKPSVDRSEPLRTPAIFSPPEEEIHSQTVIRFRLRKRTRIKPAATTEFIADSGSDLCANASQLSFIDARQQLGKWGWIRRRWDAPTTSSKRKGLDQTEFLRRGGMIACYGLGMSSVDTISSTTRSSCRRFTLSRFQARSRSAIQTPAPRYTLLFGPSFLEQRSTTPEKSTVWCVSHYWIDSDASVNVDVLGSLCSCLPS
ncbi:hypothetical protein BDN71DRAFT_1507446 [Pleurotus eryngii]|uniref:Uncharacterized protein n=1 Tax=Pleurotus eryngii TaxID=5323 RepID=A0A9P5ZY22_PLEER|nr:hypothetical protein BDN71DRAFT_1507446 [Pleurotus eryngii]